MKGLIMQYDPSAARSKMDLLALSYRALAARINKDGPRVTYQSVWNFMTLGRARPETAKAIAQNLRVPMRALLPARE